MKLVLRFVMEKLVKLKHQKSFNNVLTELSLNDLESDNNDWAKDLYLDNRAEQ